LPTGIQAEGGEEKEGSRGGGTSGKPNLKIRFASPKAGKKREKTGEKRSG